LIKHVKLPDTTWIDAKRHLTLTHNAIEQLNIAPKDGFNYRHNTNLHSLFDVLNFTRTRMGYRRLRDRLFNPLLNAAELNRSYQMIEDMNDNMLVKIGLILKGMPDIDNYYRKIMLVSLKPRELVIIYQAYVRITKLYEVVYGGTSDVMKTVLFTGSPADEFNQFLRNVFDTLDLDKLRECTIINDDGTKMMDFPQVPIKPGSIPELDDLICSITYYEQSLQAVCDHLNSFLIRSRGTKIDYHRRSKDKNKRDKILGIDILTTEAKARSINQNIGLIDRSICGDIRIETFHSQRRITSDHIAGLITGLESCKNKLRVRALEVYYDLLERAGNLSFYDPISDMVATLDFIQAGRTAANKFKYYRPTIISAPETIDVSSDKTLSTAEGLIQGLNRKFPGEYGPQGPYSLCSSGTDYLSVSDSYLQVIGLRHPVIERIIDQPYVTNDVQLGIGPADEVDGGPKRGLLVYGANSTGKTTLARAVAIAIIMAQAGLYTAGQLSYRIFHKIFTRIGGNDDSSKGRSSFVVEMSEILIPISEADSRSLIFGDEPCRGTERYSGVSIASATIDELLERRACFIMATHQHDMLELPSFQPLKEQLQISHLNMYYDSTVEDLVIDRKLKPGSGPTIYGIEVAKSLGFSDKFIRRAMQFRAESVQISTEIVPTTRSRYNRQVYKDSCILCGSQTDLHTHHLMPQQSADERGFIGDMPKDLAGNLVTLCQPCHHKIHHSNVALKRREIISGSALVLEHQNKE
jgi:DNA mismatch repair protein MutS